MCNYQIETKSIHDQDDSCKLQDIWGQWMRHTFKTKYNQRIPLDEDGMCVFHSKHEVFKRQYQSDAKLLTLIEYCNESSHIKIIDLRGVIIDAEDSFCLKNLNLSKELNLCNSRSMVPLHIEDCYFNEPVLLDGFECDNVFSIERTQFIDRFTAIDGAMFHGNVHLSDVSFHSLFEVSGAMFLSQVNFNPVIFNGHTIFNHAFFDGENAFSYFNIECNEHTSFYQTTFVGPAQFENCKFNAEVNFSRTYFRKRFHLEAPIIAANLFFKGYYEEERIFENEVEMVIGVDSFKGAGQILFEDANLTALDGHTKAQLSELRKHNRVVLGKGTQVFKFIFHESYPYSAFTEIFLQDLLQKIKQYFDYQNIRSFEFSMQKKDDFLVVTFFTDGYANTADFKTQQFASINDMISNEVDSKIESYLQTKMKATINDALDLYFKKELDRKIIIEQISSPNIRLFAERVDKIESDRLTISKVSNTSIKVDLLELENEPSFQLSDEQFQQLKFELSGIIDNNADLLNELRDMIKELSELNDPDSKYAQLLDFLSESGIGMARSVGGATIFHFLKLLLLNGA